MALVPHQPQAPEERGRSVLDSAFSFSENALKRLSPHPGRQPLPRVLRVSGPSSF